MDIEDVTENPETVSMDTVSDDVSTMEVILETNVPQQHASSPNTQIAEPVPITNSELLITVGQPGALFSDSNDGVIPPTNNQLTLPEDKPISSLPIQDKNKSIKAQQLISSKRVRKRSKKCSSKSAALRDKRLDISDSDNRSEDEELGLAASVREAWAKPFTQLWTDRPLDFPCEQLYNTVMASSAPYCSVCALLTPSPVTPESMELCKRLSRTVQPGSDGVPARSTPSIPEICFASSAESPNPMGTNSVVSEDGTSALLVCEQCRLCVHASCYGVLDPRSAVWKCDRCVEASLDASCCLCCLRGGALKATTQGDWAHIWCALSIPQVVFMDIQKRRGINVDKLPVARYKLKCVYCNSMDQLDRPGVCTQCSLGRCTTPFHVSCAHAAGVEFTTSDWPFPVFITCSRHAHNKGKVSSRRLHDLNVKSYVYAKHKNGRYYNAQIIERDVQIFYEVDFDDGSFSDNLHPEDIEGFDSGVPPPVNSAVQVRWTDGSLYGAVFTGTNTHVMYTVEFEDGSQKKFEREEVWSRDEELPKHIKAKLSKATERKYDMFYQDEVVDSRRQRIRKMPFSLEEFSC